ncbi:alpha/beta fold hydrolase [Streptomyces flaveolus]|uniref:alpha/beta fold hydrolase n=1 Tax=Streptomyces flaveolus TaxID=67297 RepID=UPI0036F93E6A
MITYDNRGVGASGGCTPDTIEAMARDTVLFIRALGFDQVDLLGPSTSLTVQDMLKATLRHYLFFTQTEGGQWAAREFLARLKERTDDREQAISVQSIRAQLKATKRWGRTAPQDAGVLTRGRARCGRGPVVDPSGPTAEPACHVQRMLMSRTWWTAPSTAGWSGAHAISCALSGRRGPIGLLIRVNPQTVLP